MSAPEALILGKGEVRLKILGVGRGHEKNSNGTGEAALYFILRHEYLVESYIRILVNEWDVRTKDVYL